MGRPMVYFQRFHRAKRRKNLRILVVVLAALSLFPLSVVAQSVRSADDCTFFVRADFVPTAGAADGLSPASAFATIRRAAQRIDNPGEAICIGPGTYKEGDLSPPISGLSGRPIIFFGDSSGRLTDDEPGPVILEPPRQPIIELEPTVGFLILGLSHIVIEGIEITGFVDANIQIRSAVVGPSNSSNIVIRDVVITRSGGNGIDVSGERAITIEGATIIDNESSGVALRGCVRVSEDGRCRSSPSDPVRPVVLDSTIAGNRSHGIFVENAENGVILNNVIASNGVAGLGTGITLRNAERIQIANNLIYSSAESGIAVGTFGLSSPQALILGNTVYSNGRWGLELGSADSASDDAVVANNIFLENATGSLAVVRESTCGYVSGFNVLHGDVGPDTPLNRFDTIVDSPLDILTDPAGADGVLGGSRIAGRFVNRLEDDDFSLNTSANNPAIDGGYTTVGELQWSGSTEPSGRRDSGVVDIGYHANFDASLRLPLAIPEVVMKVFVRPSGSDLRDGRTPGTAMRTIKTGARAAVAGVTVVVGPGKYGESDIGPPENGGKATFVADPLGRDTGDDPDLVIIDASLGGGMRRGFSLLNACRVTVDGFYVWNANDSTIQVRAGSDGAVIRNNILFTSDSGILVRDAADVHVTNNLVYDHTNGGITISDDAPGALVSNNTVHGNLGGNGITVRSRGARAEFNILTGNSGNGINVRPGESSGYSSRYNMFNDNGEGHVGGAAVRSPTSLVGISPLFVDPAGADGVLGGGVLGDGAERFRDDRFHLSQEAAGQSETSPAVDLAPFPAAEMEVGNHTTRTDLGVDRDELDIGFHYLSPPPDVLYVDPQLGSDTSSGLLPDSPLASIAEALSRAQSGSRVQLVNATYVESGLQPPDGVSVVGPTDGLATITADGATFAFDVRRPNVVV